MATSASDYNAALERAHLRAEPHLRRAALQVFARHAEPTSIRLIRDAVEDPDGEVRATALSALGQRAVTRLAPSEEAGETDFEEAVSLLIGRLGSDPEPQARRAAAWALAEIAEHNRVLPSEQTAVLVERLAGALRADADVYVRQFAARGLSRLGAASAVDSLLVGLDDAQDSVRSVTLTALERCGQAVPIAPLLRALEARRGYLRAEAVRALAAQGARVSLRVFESSLQDSDEAVRVAAAHALLQRGQEVDPDLLFHGLGNDTSWEVRREAGNALILLVQRGMPGVLEHLVALARTPGAQWPAPGWHVRDAAIDALGGLGQATPQEVLLDLLPALPEPILAALRRAGQPLSRDAAVAIRDLLHHSKVYVRLSAAHVLLDQTAGDTLDPEVAAAVAEVVIPLVSDAPSGDDYDVAVQLLAPLGPWIPSPVLLALLAASDDHERSEAITALQAGDPDLFAAVVAESQAILHGDQPGPFFSSLLMWYVAQALGEVPVDAPDAARAVATLASLLDWPYPEVRMQAASALGHFRHAVSETTRARLAALRQDPNRWVRDAVERALQRIATSQG